ncbi:hypothetical protein B0H19DRAFT_1077152 [Mycena capillaripes]|nr:hypothetical protein B0H19DRAFT_1077152 [Mycena capillaripes]
MSAKNTQSTSPARVWVPESDIKTKVRSVLLLFLLAVRVKLSLLDCCKRLANTWALNEGVEAPLLEYNLVTKAFYGFPPSPKIVVYVIFWELHMVNPYNSQHGGLGSI